MFRRFTGLVLALLITTPALADPQQDMRGHIAAGRIAGAEMQMRRLHDEARESGDYSMLRHINGQVFSTTDPQVIDFLELWMAAEPTSVYALTGWFWNRHHIAYILRGERFVSQTSRSALSAYGEELQKGARAAFAAYDAAPDYLPASDAMLVLVPAYRDRIDLHAVLDAAMEHAPTARSLSRAIWASSPEWGGSALEMSTLCARYADRVPNYDTELCLIDAGLNYGVPALMRKTAWRAVWTREEVSLDIYRLRGQSISSAAEHWDGKKMLERHRALAHRALTLQGYLQAARFIAEASNTPGYVEEATAAYYRRVDEALARDPLNPEYLRLKINRLLDPADFQPIGPEVREEARALWNGMLTYRGHDPVTWQIGGEIVLSEQQVGISLRALPYLANAAALDLNPPRNAMLAFQALYFDWDLVQRVQAMAAEGRDLGPLDFEPEQMLGEVQCPLLRAARLVDGYCQRAGEDIACSEGLTGLELVVQVLTSEGIAAACPAVMEAGFEELRYSFRPVEAFTPLGQ